jgi:hypothetical protein
MVLALSLTRFLFSAGLWVRDYPLPQQERIHLPHQRTSPRCHVVLRDPGVQDVRWWQLHKLHHAPRRVQRLACCRWRRLVAARLDLLRAEWRLQCKLLAATLGMGVSHVSYDLCIHLLCLALLTRDFSRVNSPNALAFNDGNCIYS